MGGGNAIHRLLLLAFGNSKYTQRTNIKGERTLAETSNKISSQLSEEGSLVSRLMSLDMKTINYQII